MIKEFIIFFAFFFVTTSSNADYYDIMEPGEIYWINTQGDEYRKVQIERKLGDGLVKVNFLSSGRSRTVRSSQLLTLPDIENPQVAQPNVARPLTPQLEQQDEPPSDTNTEAVAEAAFLAAKTRYSTTVLSTDQYLAEMPAMCALWSATVDQDEREMRRFCNCVVPSIALSVPNVIELKALMSDFGFPAILEFRRRPQGAHPTLGFCYR